MDWLMSDEAIRRACDREFWLSMKGIIQKCAAELDAGIEQSTAYALMFGHRSDIFTGRPYSESPTTLIGSPRSIIWVDDDSGELQVLEGL